VSAGESLHPNQRVGTPDPSVREKRGNLHHNKNHSRCNISSTPLSQEFQEKKLKLPIIGAHGINNLTKNNSRFINLNAE
jgi:hypothetical protein